MRLWNDRHAMLVGCALCLLGPAQGCPAVDGKDVVVGEESDALFLGACAGERTDCDREVKTKSVGTSKPLECDPETGTALEVDWESPLLPTECTDSASQGCMVDTESIAIDDDGAAWVVMNFCPFGDPADPNMRPCGVWLARYTATGTQTAGTTVVAGPNPNPGNLQYRADVAVTSAGHAVVTVYSLELLSTDEGNEKVILAEYDKDGTIVAMPTTLTGIAGTRVAATSDGEVVVASNAAGNAHHGVLAEIHSDRTLRFSQTNLHTHGQSAGAGVAGVSVNSQDRISVLMSRDLETDPQVQHMAFSQFDRNGNPIWDRVLETDFDHGRAKFGMDGDGGLIMLGHIPTPGSDLEAEAMLEKVSASGELVFAMHLPADFGDHQLTVEPGGDNRIFVTSSRAGGAYVREISADGARCVLHDVPDGVGFPFVAHRGGFLYYLMDFRGPDHPAHFGRLKAIESE